jgi:hypothetical protein
VLVGIVRIDPDVNRLKFDREVHRLAEQRSTLESRGMFVLNSTTFPSVELLFVPRHPMQTAFAASQSGSIILPQPAMVQLEIPSLAGRAFKAHFDLADYDLRAPSLEFRDFWTDTVLPYTTMFRALEFEQQRKAHVVLLDDHPTTGKPFLCLRGIREYHEHPQHSGDDWLLYRAEMSLFSIVMSVWRVCVDLVHPRMAFQPNGVQVGWAAEEKA